MIRHARMDNPLPREALALARTAVAAVLSMLAHALSSNFTGANSVGLTRESLLHSLRTTVAAVLSLMLAHALKLPEFYWAPISTIVILLSPSDPFTLAWQRFAGTALGAVVGAIIATYFPINWMVYGAAILVCGILSALLRLGSAYRFAAITLSIILLIAHAAPPWVVAYHRFIEVSLGIAVALVLTKLWRLPSPK